MSNEHVEVLRDLIGICRAAIKAGDWKVDGACDPDSLLRHADAAIEALSAPQPPAEAQAQDGGWCDACEGAGHTPDAADPFARPACCPDCAGSGLAEHSITANDTTPPSAPVGVESIHWLQDRRDSVAEHFPESDWLPHMDAILAALAQRPGFASGDMADAAAQGFRDGVASVEETLRDAMRWRMLMAHCKHDHIWYHVLPPHLTEKHDSVEAVLDALAAQQGGSDNNRQEGA